MFGESRLLKPIRGGGGGQAWQVIEAICVEGRRQGADEERLSGEMERGGS